MQEVRLIDADALLKKCIEGDGDNKFTEGYNFAVQEISAYIALAPTIEPEVRHGKGCKFCKGRSYTKKPLTVITRTMKHVEVVFEYCPACGRKMNGDADNG